MTRHRDPPTLRPFADAIDARDWPHLRSLLSVDFHGLFVHTGRSFDADGFVDFQRDYPGVWRFTLVEEVASGGRLVARSRVSDGHETYWVATFATLRDGLLSDLVEVWTEAVRPLTSAGAQPPA